MDRKIIYKAEGFALFLVSLHLWNTSNEPWLIYIIFFLAPDIAALGYLKNKKTGALIYNLVHNYALALMLVALGVLLQTPLLQLAGIIVLGHTGLDRFVGYNLKKYP